MREDRFAFLLQFCGMVLVTRQKASLAETLAMLPLNGKGRLLARELDPGGADLTQQQQETGAHSC